MADKKNEIAEEMPEESLEELFAKLDQVAKEAGIGRYFAGRVLRTVSEGHGNAEAL